MTSSMTLLLKCELCIYYTLPFRIASRMRLLLLLCYEDIRIHIGYGDCSASACNRQFGSHSNRANEEKWMRKETERERKCIFSRRFSVTHVLYWIPLFSLLSSSPQNYKNIRFHLQLKPWMVYYYYSFM